MKIDAKARHCLEVLTKWKVRLPLYQRPYVWQSAAVKLLDDVRDHIAEIADDEDIGYFVGNILLVADEDDQDTVDLVDGQQRLTTLFIAIAYLKEQLKKSADTASKAPWFQNQLVIEPEPGEFHARLSSARSGLTPIFTRIALTGSVLSSPVGLKNKQLDAYGSVLEEVKAWVQANLPTPLSKLEFATYLARKVYAVVIEYPDTGTALRVFEDLNHKGEDLLQAELMKSAFMKMCKSEHEWDAVDKDWNSIMENASSRKNGDDGFIRKALLAMVLPSITTPKDAPKAKELLKVIRTHCERSKESSREVLQKIALFSRALGQFGDGSGKYADGQSTAALVRLRRIPSTAEFVSTMVCCMPTALSLTSRERLCLVIEAAASVIGLSKASKNINYTVQPWYVKMRGLTDDTVDDFIQGFFGAVIKDKLPDFETAFRGMRVGAPRGKTSDTKWAKHFLALIEDYLRSGLGVQRVSYEAGTKSPVVAAHLEHILPQSAAARQELSEEVVYSIGNCTLLEAGKNKSIQDASYSAKLVIYQKSDFRLTNELGPSYHGVSTRERRFLDEPDVAAILNYSTFSNAEVAKRTQGLLNLLLKVWGLTPFAYSKAASSLTAEDTPVAEPVVLPPEPAPLPLSDESFLGSRFPEQKWTESAPRTSRAEPEFSFDDTAGINSTVVLSYCGAKFSLKLLAAEVSSTSRTSLNVRKGVGRELIGRKVGDTFRDSLFGGPVEAITVIAVS